MDTNFTIWTYNTTKTTKYTCFKDDVCNITNDVVYFNRSYYYEKWKTYPMQANFDARDKSLMTVGPIGGLKTRIESLEFASSSYMCGIFYVRPANGFGHRGWRDLRFKDPNKRKVPEQECLDRFHGVARKTSIVYYDFCSDPK
nr:uncharacterized protein LOC119165816 [Rhipicephalus microplus]